MGLTSTERVGVTVCVADGYTGLAVGVRPEVTEDVGVAVRVRPGVTVDDGVGVGGAGDDVAETGEAAHDQPAFLNAVGGLQKSSAPLRLM